MRGPIAATRLAFLAAGCAIAAWAPLVPHAAARLGTSAAQLGALLLCLGLGSLLAMPLTARLVDGLGCRRVLIATGAITLLTLPLLALSSTRGQLGAALMVFGAALGMFDSAMNIHGVAVEHRSGRRLMSGFHGCFSLGGIAGAGLMAILLSAGVTPVTACVGLALLLAALLGLAWPGLQTAPVSAASRGPVFALPRGIVAAVSLLCFLVGVIEGAVIDWSAMFLTAERHMDPAHAGLGYAAFSATMMIGRFTGDGLVARFGPVRVLALGGICVALGFFLAGALGTAEAALAGFLLVGLGAANMFPVLCSFSGRQDVMPPGHAVAAIVMFGYGGIMAGPALIGLGAEWAGLEAVFIALGAAALSMALSARVAR